MKRLLLSICSLLSVVALAACGGSEPASKPSPAPAAQPAAPGTSFDVLVKGGTLYDGSGGAPVRADVGVNGDQITAVGDLSAAAGKTVVDASGMAVSPGFVNMMSGDDSLRVDGRSMSDIKQGVTIEIMGEGYSMGPLNEAMRKEAIEAQGDLKYPITWKTLHEGLTIETPGATPETPGLESDLVVRNLLAPPQTIAVPFAMPQHPAP
jgi:N-acyl-D-amino-acid deacylase